MEKKFYEEYKWTQLKFWQNFRDYYKLHIFIVALAVAMLVIGVRNTKGRFYCVQFNHDTTDTNFDTISPMMYVELCRVM